MRDESTPMEGRIVVEASTLGLAPGSWPGEVVFGGERFVKGAVEYERYAPREIAYVTYRSQSGVTMMVLND